MIPNGVKSGWRVLEEVLVAIPEKSWNIESDHYLLYFKHISQALEAQFLEPLGLKIEPKCV